MPKRTKKPAGIPLADLAKDYPDALVSDDGGKPKPIADVIATEHAAAAGMLCPICGGSFEGNRCPVDGFQWSDS